MEILPKMTSQLFLYSSDIKIISMCVDMMKIQFGISSQTHVRNYS